MFRLPMDFCISNVPIQWVGQASCLPIPGLQAGRLHHIGAAAHITYAEVSSASPQRWRKPRAGLPVRARRSRRSRSAFTLIELMVAVGLTTVLLWGLLQLFSSASRFSTAVTTESELCAAGRAALERMCREIASMASLKVGYLKITCDADDSDGTFDTIQFVAPVGLNGQLAHVKFTTRVIPTGRALGRAFRNYENDSSRLDDPTATDTTTPDDFGITVDRFKLSYIPSSAAMPPSRTSATFPSSGQLPLAVLIELRLHDPRGNAALTLSAAAVIPGSADQ